MSDHEDEEPAWSATVTVAWWVWPLMQVTNALRIPNRWTQPVFDRGFKTVVDPRP